MRRPAISGKRMSSTGRPSDWIPGTATSARTTISFQVSTRSCRPAPIRLPGRSLRMRRASSTRMTRVRTEIAAVALALLIPSGILTAGTVQVQVTLPLPERIDMTGISNILVTRLVLENDNPKVDLNREMVSLLRRELRKKTSLKVLDVEPPPLPEQSLEELVANSSFWKDMGEKYGADLILTGSLRYAISDRTGFVHEDVISPLPGQRARRRRLALPRLLLRQEQDRLQPVRLARLQGAPLRHLLLPRGGAEAGAGRLLRGERLRQAPAGLRPRDQVSNSNDFLQDPRRIRADQHHPLLHPRVRRRLRRAHGEPDRPPGG